jgi:hypothetical protein
MKQIKKQLEMGSEGSKIVEDQDNDTSHESRNRCRSVLKRPFYP